MPRSSNPPSRESLRVASLPQGARYRYVRRRWHVLCTVIDTLGTMLFAVWHWFAARRKLLPLDDVRSIGVIQLDHLGDAILTSGLLRALRRRWPQARLEVIASPWNAAVFARAAEVDTIHTLAVNRFRRPSPWWWPLAIMARGLRLRQRRFDLMIDVRGELPHAVLMYLCGAQRRVGWPAGGGGFLLTDALAYQVERHQLDSRRAIVEHLQIELPEDETLAPSIEPADVDRAQISMLLAQRLSGSQPLVVLHIGAGTSAKQWPTAHWRELLGRLIVELDARVALVGSAAEQPLAEAIREGHDWPQVVDLTGQLALGELAALCERAEAFVGADSGPAHLAAAVGAPVVALFSGTNRASQWRPVGEFVRVLHQPVACSPCHRDQCPLADHPCLNDLAPTRVIAALRELLVTPTLPLVPLESLHDRSRSISSAA